MVKRLIASLASALALVAFLLPAPPADAAQDKVHRVVIHVDDKDPKRMNLALNNAQNIDAYYKEKGEEVMGTSKNNATDVKLGRLRGSRGS